MAKDKKKTSEHAESAPEETKSTKKAKKSDAVPAKKEDGQKKNFFQSIGKWFHDLRIEFNNVTWPSWNTVSINTSVVLVVIVAGSIVVGLLDSGVLKLMEFLIGLSQNS